MEYAKTGKSPETCQTEPNRRRRVLEVAALQEMMIQKMTSSVAISQSHDRCYNLMGPEFADVRIVVVKAAFPVISIFSLFSLNGKNCRDNETMLELQNCVTEHTSATSCLPTLANHYKFLTIPHQMKTNLPFFA